MQAQRVLPVRWIYFVVQETYTHTYIYSSVCIHQQRRLPVLFRIYLLSKQDDDATACLVLSHPIPSAILTMLACSITPPLEMTIFCKKPYSMCVQSDKLHLILVVPSFTSINLIRPVRSHSNPTNWNSNQLLHTQNVLLTIQWQLFKCLAS